ncbi:aldo/keto reductase [Siccirubricoccus deserti]
MSRTDGHRSVRLLQPAFDASTTHFDTARSHGYGEAEVAVGDLLAAVGRDRVAVATIGIPAPRRSPMVMAAKAAARLVALASKPRPPGEPPRTGDNPHRHIRCRKRHGKPRSQSARAAGGPRRAAAVARMRVGGHVGRYPRLPRPRLA